MIRNRKTIGSVAWRTMALGACGVLIGNWFYGFVPEPAVDILAIIIAFDVGMSVANHPGRRRKSYFKRIDEGMAAICFRKPDNEDSIVVEHADVRAAQEDGRLPPFFNVDEYFSTPRIREYLCASGRTLPVREAV